MERSGIYLPEETQFRAPEKILLPRARETSSSPGLGQWLPGAVSALGTSVLPLKFLTQPLTQDPSANILVSMGEDTPGGVPRGAVFDGTSA